MMWRAQRQDGDLTQAAKEHEVCEEAPELPFLVHESSIEVDGEGRNDLQQQINLSCHPLSSIALCSTCSWCM